MKIKSLHIKNFKSIVDLTINEPNPFTVFVGPNGSGKSNIFEALEFVVFKYLYNIEDFVSLFGGWNNIRNFNTNENLDISINSFDSDFVKIKSKDVDIQLEFSGKIEGPKTITKQNILEESRKSSSFHKQICLHSRIFINNKKYQKLNFNGDSELSLSCDNLEKVLKRLLENKEKREEISEWLSLFIPEFDRIEVQKSEFSSNENLLIYQKHYERPFNKELISDGTFNIIALLTAVYQSDEPQFLCIEEPENGLNPYVIRKLVDFFRSACADKGHYIWLNTHSQTLVECLQPEEVIVVDKINGETQIKQIKGMNLHGLDMAEVWLSGALGGGTPW